MAHIAICRNTMDSIQPIILIVDDEKLRGRTAPLLENDYDVYVAGDIASAMNVLEREHVDLVLTDLAPRAKTACSDDRALKMPQPPICIMMTAYGSVTRRSKRGNAALRFVTKPLNLDKVEMLIARALRDSKLEQENQSLRQQVDERYGLENMIGIRPPCTKY